jgi:hypothetical protein
VVGVAVGGIKFLTIGNCVAYARTGVGVELAAVELSDGLTRLSPANTSTASTTQRLIVPFIFSVFLQEGVTRSL